ncbi:T9SS type B sorting domain-containing protein [Flavobacterium terrae]|uniref:Gliding motility-associated C-terminal domain-containing protein n=1 Tax=Flavobacterium terrae TaxID=415425 RepID=A0A1M6CT42_9FLAO|nr:choice-of-anchor L domain-containing protein [Flavobacterium terrae]SHI64139.1 gliding motility-associated C-terminal domain-containing protein [Flavobacterium terrae]
MESFLKLITLLSFAISNAQYIQVDDTYTAQQLIQNVFASNGCGNVSNIVVSGGNFGTEQSYGYFSQGTSSFPFANGIVLSTGKAVSAIGPNTGNSSEGATSWGGDADLEQAIGVNNTINATVIEFDFIPFTNNISFDYIFSSEQYLSNPSANQCGYTDGFAFLLKPVGSSSYQNLALVPGTNTPVSVNTIRGAGTICPPANEAYFDAFNGFNNPTTFNGQTKILKATSVVTPGTTYHIKLVIADQGNNLYDSAIFLGGGSFQSSTDLGPDHLIATNNPYCAGENITLNATQPGTNTYKWFKDGVDTGITTPTFIITDNNNSNEVIYSVEVLINGACLSTGEVKIQFASLPNINNQTLVQCDDDNNGNATFNLTKLDDLIKNGDTSLGNVTYYETIGGSAITNPISYLSIPKTIYAEVANSNGCKSTCQVNLQIANNPVNSPITYEKCDEDGTKDGKTTFDLNTEVTPVVLNGLPSGLTLQYYSSEVDLADENNALQNNFINTTANTQTIFARIINGPDCYGLVEINLVVNYLSPTNFETETIGICQGIPLTLSVPNIYSAYLWSNGDTLNEITISTSGNYSVEVTDANGCRATKTFIVTSSAPASNIDAQIIEFTGNENNSILITYTDNGGDYVFSIDGINYQTSPQFSNLPAGEYNISVKDLNGCLPTPTKTIYVLDYPSFFTPNGDGYNDTWVIKNIKLKPNTVISIFDRFGKLLKQFNSNSEGWNGTFNGQNLPATDYWFTLTLANGNIIRGHFTLKR